jgi:hypothetical protein
VRNSALTTGPGGAAERGNCPDRGDGAGGGVGIAGLAGWEEGPFWRGGPPEPRFFGDFLPIRCHLTYRA